MLKTIALVVAAIAATPTDSMAQAKAPRPAPKVVLVAPPVSVDPLATFIKDVRSQMEGTFYDYPSARFKDVRLGNYENQIAVCGSVNSKNRAGGYVGFTGFYAMATMAGPIPTPAELHVMEHGQETYGYTAHCRDMQPLPGDYTARFQPTP